MAIKRIAGHITKKQVEALDTAVIVNYTHRDLAVLDAVMALLMPGWYGSSQVIRGLGEPNLICRDYESSPGVWMFLDEDTGIKFLVWSDGWKKNPWKGSSFEFDLNGAPLLEMPQAFERLVKYMMRTGGYYGSFRQQELERFANEPDA